MASKIVRRNESMLKLLRAAAFTLFTGWALMRMEFQPLGAAFALAFPARTLLSSDYPQMTPLPTAAQGAPAILSTGHSREAAAGADPLQHADAGTGKADVAAQVVDGPEHHSRVQGR